MMRTNNRDKHVWVAGAVCLKLLSASAACAAPPTSPALPVLLEGDRLTYDADREVYTAEQNAEASRGRMRLRADMLTYDATADTMHAAGNAVITRDNTLRLTADQADLSDGFERGTLSNVTGAVGQTTRLLAQHIDYDRERSTVLTDVLYSPCAVCETLGAPLWQLHSDVVTDDVATQTVTHQFPRFDVFGVPVATFPYLSHPSPGVRRRSGWLTPSFVSDLSGRNNGSGISTPYFFALAPDRDLTLTPTLYSSVLPMLEAEYRQRFDTLSIAVHGYGTHSDLVRKTGARSQDDYRGALAVRGLGTRNADRYMFELMPVSDDTFLRRYRITDARVLSNRLIYVTPGDDGNNALRVALESRHSMSVSDNNDTIPVVLPFVTLRQHVGSGWFGFDYRTEESFLALHRITGRDTVRTSAEINGTQLLSSASDPLRLTAFNSLRTDLYRFTPGVGTSNTNEGLNGGTRGRVLPAVGLNAALPVYGRHDWGIRDVFEPQVEVILAPYDTNNKRLPNEDGSSSSLETYDPFGLQRLYGKDRVETGPRVNAGFRHSLAQDDLGRLNYSLVQSFRARRDDTLQAYGLGDTRSDYVLRSNYRAPFGLSLSQTLRADKNTLARRSQFNTIDYAFGDYTLNASYLATKAGVDPTSPNAKEDITYGGSYRFNDRWRASLSLTENLQNSTHPGQRIGLNYTDACLTAQMFAARNLTSDRDVASGVTFGLQVSLIPVAADAVAILNDTRKEFP